MVVVFSSTSSSTFSSSIHIKNGCVPEEEEDEDEEDEDEDEAEKKVKKKERK